MYWKMNNMFLISPKQYHHHCMIKKYDSPSDNPQSDRITIRSYVREFRDIDANGDGLSEVLFSVENITTIYPYNGPIDDPEVIVGDPTVPIHRPVESYSSFDYYIVNPNTSQKRCVLGRIWCKRSFERRNSNGL